ncbi:MAG: DUF4382 domain-containing protein [Burkholderiaceae bacterium]|jgi:hypothetical protein|nr:DUF4382 domain-containing protein [Burkholderiaceae bacterium]
MLVQFLRRACQTGLLALVAVFAGCGGGGDSTSTDGPASNDLGQLAIRLTDSQSCDYRSVWVTVEQVRIHQSAAADDGAAGWRVLNLSPARRVDLLTLRNGVFVDLGTLPLPAGNYSQVRLVLAGNAGGLPPFANQLDLAGGSVVELKTPSAQQSGLKLNVQMSIQPGQLGELVLDFDPCRSVVKAGNSGRYNLKPVIQAYVNPTNDIEGYTLPGAVVSAQRDGVALKSTTAGIDGRFVLWPVATGTYDLVITGTGLANAVLAGVQVGTGETTVSTAATPLLPQPSPAFGQVSGSVTMASPIDAELRALQQVGAYPGSATPLRIETARTAADAELGTFAFSLPTAAPQRAVWQSGVTSYAFTPVDDQAGLYTIEARAAGFDQPKYKDVSLKLGNAPDTDFAFP